MRSYYFVLVATGYVNKFRNQNVLLKPADNKPADIKSAAIKI